MKIVEKFKKASGLSLLVFGQALLLIVVVAASSMGGEESTDQKRFCLIIVGVWAVVSLLGSTKQIFFETQDPGPY